MKLYRRMEFLQAADLWLFQQLNGLRFWDARWPPFRTFAIWLNGSALNWFLYVFLFLALRKAFRQKAMFGVLMYFFSGELVEVWIKPHFSRPRPNFNPQLHADVLGRVPLATSFSFPSGTTFVLAASLTWLFQQDVGAPIWLKRVMLALAVTIACAKVYAGLHYPSDIVAGALGGYIFAVGLTRWLRAD